MPSTFKHFFPFAYAEFWDRVSFYGLQSLLVIMLTHTYHQSLPSAYDTYGAFSGLSFGFGIIGGLIADRLLGTWLSLLAGGLCSMVGNLLLINASLPGFYVGMAFIVVGIGLLKPSNACALNQVFEKKRFHKVFTYFYLSANTGGIVGPIIYGLTLSHHNSPIGFIGAALGLASAMMTLLLGRNLKPKIHATQTTTNRCLALISIMAAIIIVGLIMANYLKLAYLAIPALILLTLYLMHIYRRVTPAEQSKLLALIIPTLSCLVLFTVLLQMFSSIVIWLKTNLPLTLAGWHVPSTWFGIVSSLFVLIALACLTPLWRLAEKQRPISSNIKLVIGLTITAIAFALLALGALLHMVSLTVILLIIAAGLLAVAEIIIIPVAIAQTFTNAPQHYQTTMMGLFYFTLTLSGYLSGEIATFSPIHSHAAHAYSLFFAIIAGSILLLTLLIYWLQRILA